MIGTSTMKELKQCKFIVKRTNQAYYKFLNAFILLQDDLIKKDFSQVKT